MAEMYGVKVKVISQKGTCALNHKVGDEFSTMGTTPEGICLGAFNAMMPSVWALMFGGKFPWSQDPDAVTVACPDGDNPVVFELRRVPTEQ